MSKKKSSTGNRKVVSLVVSLLVIVLAVTVFYMIAKKDNYSSNSNASKTCKMIIQEEHCIEDFIGLSQQEAINRAKQYDLIYKIVSIDGVDQVNTQNRADIYFEIENGVVVRGHF
jgi:hypothetical protein